MNKRELWKHLSAGEKLNGILPVVPGDDCLIMSVTTDEFKQADPEDIVYMPDLKLNEILYDADLSNRPGERMHILEYCYTKQMFLDMCKGNTEMALSLFCLSNWQNPDLDDLADCTNNAEAKTFYGETWDEFNNRPYLTYRTKTSLMRLSRFCITRFRMIWKLLPGLLS